MRLLKESKNSIIEKIRSRAGETIAETLVALLIAALALTMLAGAISAAGGIVTKSRNTLNSYYSQNESTVVRMSTSKGNNAVNLRASGTSGSYLDTSMSYDITYYENDTFTKAPVIAYKKKAN